MAFVEFKNVSKVYQSGEIMVKAVDGVDFHIEEGEFVVIVGSSGAGKTTILNMLGGMEKCTQGEIRLDGDVVSTYKRKKLTEYRRHDIGFVFQFYNLIPNLTALENVELASQMSNSPIDSKMILEKVNLGHRLKNFPAQLSGGEQQRVSIARAIAKNPKILLCDEPTGALDYKTGKSILELLHNICRYNNKTVIVITHNQELTKMADRVIKVSSGKIVQAYKNQDPVSAERIEW